MNIEKIYWSEQDGTVYWVEGDEIAFAPMNRDKTADLQGGGIVEIWGETPAEAAENEARVKTTLGVEV